MNKVALPPVTQPVVEPDRTWTDPWYRVLYRMAGLDTRERLSTSGTIYVRADGNDGNTGGSNTSTGAFLTLQGAYNYARNNLDLAGQSLTISMGTGTFSGVTVITAALTGQPSAGGLLITGTTATTLTSTDSNATFNVWHSGARARIQGGMTIQNTHASGSGIRCADNAYVEIGNINWGSVGDAHVECGMHGAAYFYENYTISGGGARHLHIQGNGVAEFYDLTVTATTPVTFSDAFVIAYDGGMVQSAGMTYSGSYTCRRFEVYNGGGIDVFGGSTGYFPGTTAGTADAATYGFYA